MGCVLLGWQSMGLGSGRGVSLGMDLSAAQAHPLGRVQRVPLETHELPQGNVHSLHTMQQSPFELRRGRVCFCSLVVCTTFNVAAVAMTAPTSPPFPEQENNKNVVIVRTMYDVRFIQKL